MEDTFDPLDDSDGSTMHVHSLVVAHNEGNDKATTELLELLYQQLRRIASALMVGEHSPHTLQTTALVNEAYMRLFGQQRVRINDRSHFLNLAARTMRRILIEHARKRLAKKRGAGAIRVTLSESSPVESDDALDLVALDEALQDLARLSDRQAQVIDLRYFAGLTVEEAAKALNVSPRTVKDDTRVAKAWLRRRLLS